MKSEMCVRDESNELTPITNLIAHHSFTDTINQTGKFICILDIVEESHNVPLLCQRVKFLENAVQFPNSTCLLDSINLKRCGPTVPVPFSSFLPYYYLQKQVYRVNQKGS